MDILSNIALILHVPLLQNGVSYTLHQYLHNPVVMAGTLVQFMADPYLVLSSDRTSALSLSAADIMNCRKYGGIMFCPNENVLFKGKSHMCLFALFENQSPEKHCQMRIRHASYHVQHGARHIARSNRLSSHRAIVWWCCAG